MKTINHKSQILNKNTDYRPQTNSGFVILFTVLIASIVLAMSLGISSVSYKELILSSTARDGQYAFNAANTGVECALFNDIKNRLFDNPSSGTPIVCDQVVGGSGIVEDRGSGIFIFSVDIASNRTGGKNCTLVEVVKTISGSVISTKITSRGYNVSCSTRATLGDTSLKVVERVLEVSY